MPLDSSVPRYRFEPPSLASFAKMKAVAGGMFRAAVPTSVRVEPRDEDAEPVEHSVVMDLDVIDGRLVCTRLELRMTEGGPSVTADALRRVPVGRYLRDAAASGLSIFEVDTADERTTHPFVPPARGFADGGMTDEVLRDVARLYHWALATGDAPLGLLERDYGISRGKASRWITTARRRGFVKDDSDDG